MHSLFHCFYNPIERVNICMETQNRLSPEHDTDTIAGIFTNTSLDILFYSKIIASRKTIAVTTSTAWNTSTSTFKKYLFIQIWRFYSQTLPQVGTRAERQFKKLASKTSVLSVHLNVFNTVYLYVQTNAHQSLLNEREVTITFVSRAIVTRRWGV